MLLVGYSFDFKRKYPNYLSINPSIKKTFPITKPLWVYEICPKIVHVSMISPSSNFSNFLKSLLNVPPSTLQVVTSFC
jgi:hypothetical protein